MPAPTTEHNLDLMAPLAAILNASPTDTPTKVNVLVDLAAGLLARDGQMREKREMRRTADAVRARLVTVIGATHDWIDSRVPGAPKVGG